MKHSQASKVHVPYSWIYADEAARTGASGFLSEDLGKMAWQQDNDTLWILVATTPTWQAIAGAHTHIESQITDLDHTDDTAIHDNVSGEINVITEKTVPADADLLVIEDSAASYAKKKVQIGSLPLGWHVRSTPPGSPTAGDGWYNTTNGIVYVYDGTRSKWLSVGRHTLLFGKGGGTDGAYLELTGGISNANGGYFLPHASTILGIGAHASGGQANKVFDIYVSGSSVGSYTLSTYDYVNSTLNINVASSAPIMIFVSADGANVNDLSVVLTLAWRHV